MSEIYLHDLNQLDVQALAETLRDSGKLSEETLHAALGQIVAGLKPGRESEDETNLFWHRVHARGIIDALAAGTIAVPDPAGYDVLAQIAHSDLPAVEDL